MILNYSQLFLSTMKPTKKYLPIFLWDNNISKMEEKLDESLIGI